MDTKIDGLGESLKNGIGKRDGYPVVTGPPQRSLDLSYRQRDLSRAFCTEEWQNPVDVSDPRQLLQELILQRVSFLYPPCILSGWLGQPRGKAAALGGNAWKPYLSCPGFYFVSLSWIFVALSLGALSCYLDIFQWCSKRKAEGFGLKFSTRDCQC